MLSAFSNVHINTYRFVEDESLFQTWHNNRDAKAMYKKCTDLCRITEICRMWFPNYDEIEACVDYLGYPTDPLTPPVTTQGPPQNTETPPITTENATVGGASTTVFSVTCLLLNLAMFFSLCTV